MAAPMNFQEAWQESCRRARVKIADTATASLAQSLTNDYYEELCNLCPEAPWMKRSYRFTSYYRLSGEKATWTTGSPTLVLDATEALTTSQRAAFLNGRVGDGQDSNWYLADAIPTGTQITLDLSYLGETTALDGRWELVQDTYAFPSDYNGSPVLESGVTGFPLEFKGETELRELRRAGVVYGVPQEWYIAYDESSVPLIVLYPAPEESNIYTLRYSVQITRLTGTENFLIPNEGIQAILYLVAGDLITILKEDAPVGAAVGAVGSRKWTALTNKYAPERAHPRFKLPASLRPWGAKIHRAAGMHVADDSAWARE